MIEELPRTQHGKIDRRALLADVSTGTVVRGEYVAPRTPVEATLASMWCEMLMLEKVGVHESFFDLGGHSLLATRLVARIRHEFGTVLPLRSVFDAPTIAGQASLLAEEDELETIEIEVEL
jgi:acyl carrier protein